MSSREFAEWMAFYRLEPWGDERADLRAGIIASTVANVNRDRKKRRAFKPGDFMPRFERDEKSPEAMKRMVEHLNVMFRGRDLREKRDGDAG